MQAVQTRPEHLSPEQQAQWLRIVDKLGGSKTSSGQVLVSNEQLLEPGVFEFLTQQWQIEEVKRRQRERYIGFLFEDQAFRVLIIAFVCPTIASLIQVAPKFAIFTSILLQVPFAVIIRFLDQRRQRQVGLASLLTRKTVPLPCSILVEALVLARNKADVWDCLADRLPNFHNTDTQPLTKYHQQLLLTELKTGMRINWSRTSMQADSPFLVAVIQYLGQEFLLGNTVPNEIAPLLTRFVDSNKAERINISRKNLNSAAEQFLQDVATARKPR